MTAIETDDAIVVRGANKRYGDFVALDQVDFVVPTGSLTALLGPSGSGKSTLLRTIAGLDHPDTGSVTINDPSGSFWPWISTSEVVVRQMWYETDSYRSTSSTAFAKSDRSSRNKRRWSGWSPSSWSAQPIAFTVVSLPAPVMRIKKFKSSSRSSRRRFPATSSNSTCSSWLMRSSVGFATR